VILLCVVCPFFSSKALDFHESKYRMKVSFPTYSKNETLTNFPVLLVFNQSITNFQYGKFSSPVGGDLRFRDSDNSTLLNYEIERWDTNGDSLVWIQLRALESSTNFIWAFWGGGDTNAPVCTTNGSTWSESYLGVYHFSEGTNALARDCSAHGLDGTLTGMNDANWVTGMVGSCLNFDGSDDYVDIGTNASLDITGPVTISAWMITPNVDRVHNSIVTKGEWNKGHSLLIKGDAGTAGQRPLFTNNGLTSGVVTSNIWYHAVKTFDGTTTRLYQDGIQVGSVAGGTAASSTHATWIGREGYSSGRWNHQGKIDQVEISTIARSSNWVWTCWMNQVSNSVFVSCSPVEKRILGSVMSVR
jgi:hypothetical protein